MQVGDGGLPGGPRHEFGGDGPFRRAVGGLAGSSDLDAARPLVNGTGSYFINTINVLERQTVSTTGTAREPSPQRFPLVNPQSVSDSDFEDELTPRSVKLQPRKRKREVA